MKNKEKVSKLICFWLRHKPGDAELVLDEFGWTLTASVLNAINLREPQISLQDLIEINSRSDKARWEFSPDNLKIRATHGHSIPIVLDKSAEIPPEILYHGTPVNKVQQILENGLLPMQRQFVHLLSEIKTALTVAKRYGTPVLIEVETKLLTNIGWEFYKTSDSVWLTKAIPAKYLSFSPWEIVSEDEKQSLLRQLKNELIKGHLLFHIISDLALLMRRYDQDDTLFVDNSTGKVYKVHLTWNNNQVSPVWPSTTAYSSLNEWVESALVEDQFDYRPFGNS